MDVLNITEDQLAIRIVPFIFEASTFELVALGANSWSSVVYHHIARRIVYVGFDDAGEHVLVSLIQSSH